MSAYVVDCGVIDGLVAAALSPRAGDGLRFWHGGECFIVEAHGSTLDGVRSYGALVMGADELGRTLWWENVLSCAYRYPGDVSGTRPGPCGLTGDDVLAYRLERCAGAPMPAAVLGLIGEYEYQSCEHPEWGGSLAYAALDALRRRACRSLEDRDGAREWVAARERIAARWGLGAR